MREVLSQRQKSPFHLAFCHHHPTAQPPSTAPFFTHAYTRGAGEPSQSFSENPLHTCISLPSLHVTVFCLYICREPHMNTCTSTFVQLNLQIGCWTARLHFSSLFSEPMCFAKILTYYYIYSKCPSGVKHSVGGNHQFWLGQIIQQGK